MITCGLNLLDTHDVQTPVRPSISMKGPNTTQGIYSLLRTISYKMVRCMLDMTPKRTSSSIATKTNPVPLTQNMQGTNVVSAPSHSDVVLQSHVVATNTPIYLDFYLPDAMNSRLSHVMYAISNIKTPHGNSAAIVKMNTFAWQYSTKHMLYIEK